MENRMLPVEDVNRAVDDALGPLEAFSRICGELGPNPTLRWTAEDWRDDTLKVLDCLIRAAQQTFDEIMPSDTDGREPQVETQIRAA